MRRLLPEPGPVDPVAAYADLPVADGRPGVRLNMVASIDGAIAVDGTSGALGGDADRRVYQALRSLADVVLVAAGTVRAEGYGPPRLPRALVEQRRARGQADVPRIAVVTRSLDLDWTGPLFAKAAAAARPLVVTCAAAPAEALARARQAAEVVIAGEAEVDLRAALVALGEGGARSVLAEGGPRLNAALAAAGVLDEVCLTVSPRLVGGDSRRILDGPPTAEGGRPMRLRSVCEDEGFLFLRHRAAG